MLPAATWVTAVALVTPVAIALGANTTVAAGADGLTSAGPSGSPSPSVSQSSPGPSVTPSPTQTSQSPTPSPSQSSLPPTPTPTTPTATVTPEKAMEASLRALGLPTGAVDGVVNRYTRRAICAFRDLNGLPATRRPAGPKLMAQIGQATELPLLPRELFGVKALVSLTCQTTYVTNNAGFIVRVLPVSTGKDNTYHQTRTGFKRVYYRVNAWQASTLFPEPDGRPGMYRPIYFDRGIAFHGVRRPIRTVPKSHGCVRTWPKDQDWLWKRLNVRDRVFVYGNYWRPKTAPLGGYGKV